MLLRRSMLGAGVAWGVSFSQTARGDAVSSSRPPERTVIDATMLQALGAKLDGKTDDLHAMQAALALARGNTPAPAIPSVLFDLPPGSVLLSGPMQTGDCHVCVRGAGQNVSTLIMQSGGAGLWVHGTGERPAVGYFQAQDISFVDGNPSGSGSVGLSFRFAAAAPQSCMTWQGVALRKWTRPAEITNCPRNWHCENVTVFGPDFAMQDAAGFEIASTPDFSQGCFTYVFINVLVANYAWGWRYDIQAPLEGQRFYSCTCYNGWGMVQAHCHGGSGPNQSGAAYRSLLWYFADCDWQGLGYCFDLVNLRQVVVQSGFFIANANEKRLAVPSAPGTKEPRPRRRYFSFIGCREVTLRDVRLDVLEHGIENSLSLVYADAGCLFVRAYNTDIFALSPIYAAFEWADPGRPCPVRNTMSETDTKWETWRGGSKVLDPGGNQILQSVLRDSGVGEVASDGRVTLEVPAAEFTLDSMGQALIKYPGRPQGGSWFLAGPPVVTFSAVGRSDDGGPTMVSCSAEGFVLAWRGAKAGTKVSVQYRASGI